MSRPRTTFRKEEFCRETGELTLAAVDVVLAESAL